MIIFCFLKAPVWKHKWSEYNINNVHWFQMFAFTANSLFFYYFILCHIFFFFGLLNSYNRKQALKPIKIDFRNPFPSLFCMRIFCHQLLVTSYHVTALCNLGSQKVGQADAAECCVSAELDGNFSLGWFYQNSRIFQCHSWIKNKPVTT